MICMFVWTFRGVMEAVLLGLLLLEVLFCVVVNGLCILVDRFHDWRKGRGGK